MCVTIFKGFKVLKHFVRVCLCFYLSICRSGAELAKYSIKKDPDPDLDLSL